MTSSQLSVANIGKKFFLILFLMTSLSASENGLMSYNENVRWYQGPNKITFSGEVFDQNGSTYASCSDMIGTVSQVDWKGKSVTVRCNDRGPNEIELTRGAFSKLEDLDVGVLRNATITIISIPKLK